MMGSWTDKHDGRWRRNGIAASVTIVVMLYAGCASLTAQTATSLIGEALQNVTLLVRPERIGYATAWDGNKFVQCRRMPDRTLRCEAAGTTMQPTLASVLTGERLDRLAALGWTLDPAFGLHVKTFSAEEPTARVADQLQRLLADVYGANLTGLEVSTRWIADTPCPPRVGPSQNLAGSVNDATSMRAVVSHSCSYTRPPSASAIATSAADLMVTYGAATSAEIQRLRINSRQRVWVVLSPGIGYVQCSPETDPAAIYCKAQSAESWPALTAILTPQRIALLRSMGYVPPGRAPNYSKSYPPSKYTDAAIAAELLKILHEVYGYTGASKLKFKTETPG